MPRPKNARPVAFFKLTPEDFEDLDAAAERIMRVIEERSLERHQHEAGDGVGGCEAGGPREPISIPLVDDVSTVPALDD